MERCTRTVVARGGNSQVERCGCGTYHVTIGALTLRLDADSLGDVADTLVRALTRPEEPQARPESPPPPHDARERETAQVIGEWEVRLFDGPKFRYMAPRGLWHVQLWHPRARVSVLTPSRLTHDAYEIFPIAGWKERTRDVAGVRALLAREHGISFLDDSSLAIVERVFVGSPVNLATTEREKS